MASPAPFAIYPLERWTAERRPMERPVEFTHFSYDDNHTYYPDDRSVRYYYPATTGLSLSTGFEQFDKHDDSEDEHLVGLLKCVAGWEQREGRKVEGDFVTWRGMMTKLLSVPYEDRDGFEMNATLYQGSIYIEENHPYKVRSRQEQDARQRPGPIPSEVMGFWGYKFETLSTLRAPWAETSREYIESRDEHIVSNKAQYCSIVRFSLTDTTVPPQQPPPPQPQHHRAPPVPTSSHLPPPPASAHLPPRPSSHTPAWAIPAKPPPSTSLPSHPPPPSTSPADPPPADPPTPTPPITLILAGEIDALWDSRPTHPTAPIHWVELKTSAEIQNQRQMVTFEKKLLKFWLQSHLLGVPRIIVGFRDRGGVLLRLEEIRTAGIPETARRKGGMAGWDGDVCLGFGRGVLRWLKETINDEGVWRIKREPGSSHVECFRVEETGHGKLLTEEFMNWRIKLSLGPENLGKDDPRESGAEG